MALREYRRKRNFRKTPEPVGGERSKDAPVFVVQEHHASHLHYDFRLEAFGTLKSWAVPKGPSTAVGDKRLAVEVEDHPLDYANFQGRIPEGEYGAGVVKIWDKGVWVPPEGLKEAFAKGHIDFELKGRKLKGRWMLVRTAKTSGRKNQWLLMKRSEKSVVAARRSLDDIGERTSFAALEDVGPQLARLSAAVPVGADWIFETKYDGYRTLVRKRSARDLRFITRSGLDWSSRYAPLHDVFARLPAKQFVIDGEIVVEDADGKSSFSLLQQALDSADARELRFYAFDLLYVDGRDLREEPLEIRKQRLKALLREVRSKSLRFSEHVRAEGAEFYRDACARGLEGVIAKDRTAPYRSVRSSLWQKIKCGQRQEVVIGGFTEPRGSRSGLGALLVGVHDGDALRYSGRVGTGFDARSLADLREKLDAIEIEESPFTAGSPRDSASVHWVSPQFVAEVAFTEWTHDRHMRHPVFQGLREDKDASEVVQEKPMKSGSARGTRSRSAAAASKSAQTGAAGGFRITHPERVVYPADNFTKLDVANYYQSIAPWLLEHVADRPLAMVRCPEGPAHGCFFQKHVNIEQMNALEETMIRDQKTVSTDSVDGLLQLAQWSVLEIHTWQTHRKLPETPDQFVMDFDPDESVGFARVKTAALRMRDMLDELKLKSFVKVTGGKGLHVHVPIAPLYGWDDVKNFARLLGQKLAEDHPGEYTTNMSKANRKGKIFVDYLRNGFGATAIAPYSLRAREHATIAVPITWDELGRMRKLRMFGPEETLRRVAEAEGDVWPGYNRLRQKIALLGAPNGKSAGKSAPRPARGARSGAG
jgi:bifunctional non-homologous end joining protein LigD